MKAKREKQKKRMQKSLAAAIAAIIILGGTLTLTAGGSRIVNAAQTLISQIFGSKEQLRIFEPQITEAEIQHIEEDLQTAKQALSDSEFAQYKERFVKLKHYAEKMTALSDGTNERNTEVLSEEEQREYNEIVEAIESFHNQIVERTKISLEEAIQLAGYPIRRPSFIPEGYQFRSEEINPKEMFREEKSLFVEWRYSNGEFGFRTVQQPINDSELAKWAFDHIESYTINGYQLELAQYEDSNVQGMRIKIPESEINKPYEIVIIADLLSKEQMEEILLSMVRND